MIVNFMSSEESSFLSTHGRSQREAVRRMKLDMNSRVHSFYQVLRDGKYYFLKALRPEHLSDEFYRESFRKEYDLGMHLDSEYIVRYHQLIDHDDECCLVMDFVNGLTLDDFLDEHPDYFSHRANTQKFLRQLCLALQEMHRHQALHLDLKPSNIMLTRVNNDVRLIDLGCSYMDARPDSMGQTMHYAAPEQLDGTYEVDARTDIYALGWILETISEHCALPSYYQKIADRCMQEKKDDRFQSVDAILSVLDEKRHSSSRLRKIVAAGLAVVLVASIIYLRFASTATVEGTVFIDTKYQDTLYLKILSANEHSLALVQAPKGGHVYTSDVVLPDSVIYDGETYYITEIGDSAFSFCTGITNVKFPPTLTTIRQKAFNNCSALNNVHLPPTMKDISMEVFLNCTSLTYVNWPASLTTVPRNCFVSCTSLRSISFPEGVTDIKQDAFCDCQQLTEVELPSTLKRIDRGAFYQCRSLQTITLPASLEVIGEYVFHKCSALSEIRIMAAKPPFASSIVDKSFKGIVRVPEASVEAYRHAAGWKELDIQPL